MSVTGRTPATTVSPLVAASTARAMNGAGVPGQSGSWSTSAVARSCTSAQEAVKSSSSTPASSSAQVATATSDSPCSSA